MQVSRRLPTRVIAALVAFTAGGLAAAGGTSAAVIEVTTQADQAGMAAGCSLRQAITAAQTDSAVGGCPAGAGADSIRLPAGVYKLTIPGQNEGANLTGDLNVTGAGALTIEPKGNGTVVIDAAGIDRVLEHSGAGSLSIRDLTLRGGRLGVAADGGGVLNSTGSLTLDGVTLIDNSAQAGDGGAIANYAQLVMTNSTIYGNTAQRSGGGIYAPGSSVTNLRSVTITRNAADAFGTNSGNGGGVVVVGLATLNATNTVIADNFDNTPAPGQVVKDCASGVNFYPRYTLIGERDPVQCLIGFDPGTLLTGDANLGPIGDHGGPTPTVIPGAGSPLVDAAGSEAPDTCPARDQRGVTRPKGAGCDIGAVERDPEGLDGAPAAAVAGLRMSKPRPRLARTAPGRVVRFRFVVRNRGVATVGRVRACMRIGKAARRALAPLGRPCTKPRALAAGKSRRFIFRLRVRSGAGPSLRAVRFVVHAAGSKPLRAAARVRIR